MCQTTEDIQRARPQRFVPSINSLISDEEFVFVNWHTVVCGSGASRGSRDAAPFQMMSSRRRVGLVHGDVPIPIRRCE